nr:hypothetical protein [Tanacetum cinerariifolium]
RARIAQSSALPPVADEPVSPLRDVSQGEACTTISSLDAKQDRANIAKTSTLPHESTSRVTSLAADEGSLQHQLHELTDLCTSLQRQQSEMVSRFEAQELKINSLKARIKLLEDKDRGVAEHSGDDTPIKGRNLDEGEAATERVSSGFIPTAGPPAAEVPTGSDVVPTAGLMFTTATVVTPYIRRKGKETMVESETPKKKKIARDVEIARIHTKEELQIMIDGLDRNNETIAKYLQECHQFATELPLERRIELISDLVRYQDNYAKEEAERFKRKGIRFEQESVKKLKTSEEFPEEVKIPDEVPKEKRGYWKITRLGGSSASYKFFVDLLKHLDREDLNQLWALVKESLNIRPASSDKEIELWVELKRLYEPDVEDQLWTHIQNMMHAPSEWKLYDSCGVHHVTSKDNEIFMLIEKDYHLRKGLPIMMISYKLQVENYSQMGRIVGNKMHKAFLLPVMEFPLPKEVPTTSEESSHCQKKRDATAEKFALLLKSSSNFMEFSLPREVPTTSEESSHCQKKRDATAEKFALLLKSSSNCQSKSYDSCPKFGMENCDTVPTPIVEQANLKLDLVGKPVDHIDYRCMIGSL